MRATSAACRLRSIAAPTIWRNVMQPRGHTHTHTHTGLQTPILNPTPWQLYYRKQKPTPLDSEWPTVYTDRRADTASWPRRPTGALDSGQLLWTDGRTDERTPAWLLELQLRTPTHLSYGQSSRFHRRRRALPLLLFPSFLPLTSSSLPLPPANRTSGQLFPAVPDAVERSSVFSHVTSHSITAFYRSILTHDTAPLRGCSAQLVVLRPLPTACKWYSWLPHCWPSRGGEGWPISRPPRAETVISLMRSMYWMTENRNGLRWCQYELKHEHAMTTFSARSSKFATAIFAIKQNCHD